MEEFIEMMRTDTRSVANTTHSVVSKDMYNSINSTIGGVVISAIDGTINRDVYINIMKEFK